MSESSSENESTSDDSSRGISDDQLPDDLNPEENPLAREPDPDEDTGASVGGDDAAGEAPDTGQPG